MVGRIVDRFPELEPSELVDGMVPPPRFDAVRFETYIPNPDEPSQAAAVRDGRAFAAAVSVPQRSASRLRALFRGGSSDDPGRRGRYFDGGFGVGKTHLLASLWHAVPAPKAYGTFVEVTNLVGALGFAETVQRLAGHRFLAIDEFELDDPGDTMLVTRLLDELMSAGVFVAATSNTLPEKLGEGRFAAEDFLREIHSLSARFEVIRVDGPDYRHRGLPTPPPPLPDDQLRAAAEAVPGSTCDDFGELCQHLAGLHPARYGRLVDGIRAVHLSGVRQAPDQAVALRLVAFADRLYDRAIPVVCSGESLAEIFTSEMLAGGYRKKYLRAVSRLTALSRDSVGS